MTDIKKISKFKQYFRIATVLITAIIILSFKSLFFATDYSITSFFNSVRGELPPDSNIVLIHISGKDIESLGWPFKRSYYATLLSHLQKFNLKKIGIEIFLSEKLSYQSVYDSVLNKEIKNTKGIVLSSLLTSVNKSGEQVSADSVIFPAPKRVIPGLETGHINFLTDDGNYIPLIVKTPKGEEKAFSLALAGLDVPSENLMKVNFYSSWKSFKKYSFLDFFTSVINDKNKLKSLQGKILIIGVSDPLVAPSISTVFDKELPGMGFHAIAADNILNGRYIDYGFKNISTYLFLLLSLVIGFAGLKKKSLYLVILVIFIILSYFLFVLRFIELDYLALLLPLGVLFLVDSFIDLTERKVILTETLDEAENLKKTLRQKEEELKKLEEEYLHSAQNQSAELTVQIEKLNEEIAKLKKQEEDEIPAETESDSSVKNFEGIIYKSKKMESIVELIRKVAPENATVLILGESGSGKELVAQAIHRLSPRKNNEFVVINCAALSDTLLESELFGHVKGAFTDAVKDKKGRFELADKGTLFLDEIGETSENFQVKLLRVLQTGDFQRVGSSETLHADVRIVAATNKDLEKLVRDGKFREDLYYRLNVFTIKLPSLKERKEDIEVLATHFIRKESPELTLSRSVLNQLTEYNWKGNVRELESVMKRAAIFAKSENRTIIKLKDLPENLAKFDKSNLETNILELLREKKFSHSSINETARELGDLNRTVVSENFRGIFFKYYCNFNFDLEKTVREIARTDEEEVLEKVRAKVNTYLRNIEKDIEKLTVKDFSEVKIAFVSKYKNLPQKYHHYLDKVIRKILEN